LLLCFDSEKGIESSLDFFFFLGHDQTTNNCERLIL
jgi:hypothetical protein